MLEENYRYLIQAPASFLQLSSIKTDIFVSINKTCVELPQHAVASFKGIEETQVPNFQHIYIPRTMTSVKLKFRAPLLHKKEGALYFQIIHKRAVKQIGTPYRIFESEWDKKINDIISPSFATPDRHGIIKSIRNKVSCDITRLNKIIQMLHNNGKSFSAEIISQEFKAQSPLIPTVFEYMKTQIELLRKAGKYRTSETYRQTLNCFMKFRNEEDLFFDMIDDTLIRQYESQMRSSNLCRNTTSFYLRVLRSIYNRAVGDGLTEQLKPFKRVYTGVDQTARRAITLKEIKKIKELNLRCTPNLDFARDMFLFSFYMRGMSFVDIAYLQKKSLSNGFIAYNRRKTGQQLIIKWEKSMDEIVRKYDTGNSIFLLPIITSQDGTERKQYLNKMLLINRWLKRIASLAKIDTPLTMYVARHSWANIAQSQNIPIKAISMGLGHDNEATTQIYLASIQSKIIDNANYRILNLLNNCT